ncbi:putative LOC107374202-like protein [Nothobranchius furzeri]|uniref:LOC107374202-like protein n=1 Tax=Nothobranchius furzeri TaxID=105023 RepID=A0A9D3BLK9_NOTFU|nr:putative LOC107374202-like protein [Nothobranchius furzeri]
MCIRVHQLRLKKVDNEKDDLQLENYAEIKENAVLSQERTRDFVDDMEAAKHTNTLGQPEVTAGEDAGETTAEPATTRGEYERNAQSDVQPEIVCLKPGQVIKYKDRETGGLHTAKVLGHAGKATGKYRNWYSMVLVEPNSLAGNTSSVDIKQLEDFQVEVDMEVDVTGTSEEVFVMGDLAFDDAKQDGIKSWKDNDVFVEVRDEGQKSISTRWVCTVKETSDGLKPKARLVARGFEELQESELQKDSPTCASESLHMHVAVICQRTWTLNSMDIKSTFLQGIELSRDLYIRPPPVAHSDGRLETKKMCVWISRCITVLVQSCKGDCTETWRKNIKG